MALEGSLFVSSSDLSELLTRFGAEASRTEEGMYQIESKHPRSVFTLTWWDASVANCHVERERFVIDLDDYEVTISPRRAGVDDLRLLMPGEESGRAVPTRSLIEQDMAFLRMLREQHESAAA